MNSLNATGKLKCFKLTLALFDFFGCCTYIPLKKQKTKQNNILTFHVSGWGLVDID